MINNVLYISSLLPKKEYEKSVQNGTILSYASQRFHGLLNEGLIANNINVKNLSICKKSQETTIKYDGFDLLYQSNNKINNLLFFTRKITKKVIDFLNENPSNYVFFDSINVYSTIACSKAGKKYIGRIIPIVTDVFGKRAFTTTNIIKNLFYKKHEKQMNKFSKYIVLTEQIKSLYTQQGKQFSIIEGISKENSFKLLEKDFKKCFYAGIIDETFGVSNLINAFKGLDDSYSLILYGEWKLKEAPEVYLKDISNVSYGGVVTNEEIEKVERQSNLLINPRPTKYVYTEYSFPSKIMEYLSSGVPTLCTKLKGIPAEYWDFLYLIEDESVEGIMKAIKDLFEIDFSKRMKKAAEGKQFVLKNKNGDVQVRKLLSDLKL